VSYEVILTATARREFYSLTPRMQERMAAAVAVLAENPRPPHSLKLVHREGWRLRVGDYRMLYTVDDGARVVTVIAIGHRREVYRG